MKYSEALSWPIYIYTYRCNMYITLAWFVLNSQVCRFVPRKTFSETRPRHRWYLSLDLNIGVSPGFGGLIQGQIYNPVFRYSMIFPSLGVFFKHWILRLEVTTLDWFFFLSLYMLWSPIFVGEFHHVHSSPITSQLQGKSRLRGPWKTLQWLWGTLEQLEGVRFRSIFPMTDPWLIGIYLYLP